MSVSNRKPLGIRNLLIACFALLVILSLALYNTFSKQGSEEKVVDTLTIERSINVLFSAVQTAESSQRGYLLTLDSAYLAPYIENVTAIDSLLADLHSKIGNDPAQQRNFYHLEGLVSNKFEEMGRTLELTAQDRLEQALRLVKSDEGDNIMRRIRIVTKLMASRVTRLSEINKLAANKTKWITIGLFVISFLILGYSLRSILFQTGPLMHDLIKTRERLHVVNNQLADSIGDMKSALTAKQSEIQKRKRTQKENRSLIHSLRDKNQELSQFAYIASHDLQEPLRTVTNFVQLFEEEYKDQLDAEARTYFQFINSATEHMRSLINNLLNYSQIGTSGKIEEVNLEELLENIKTSIAARILESGARIEHEPLPTVYGYRFELNQLLQNLLTNAIKFTAKEVTPHIQIRAHEQLDFWEIAIQDNGIGISENDREKIFGMFKRLHSQDDYQGQGIGLAFCRKIVWLHQGNIQVDRAPTGGSIFTFTIAKKLKHEKETG